MEKSTLIDFNGNKNLITNEQNLLMKLNSLISGQPRISILEIPEFGVLTFGLSKTTGFVEYMDENQIPPYLIANLENPVLNGEFIEFDSGGTATPIPLSYCIPTDLVIKILVESFKERSLPDFINWYNE